MENLKSAEISNSVIEGIKKTKNTSVKDLTVNVIHDNATETSKIKNMYQVWQFIKGHYANDKNLSDKITVYQDSVLLKDIHAEKKSSGKVWMVDRMQVGKHVKKSN